MLKEIELFVLLVFLLVAVILIFNARFIVRSKMEKNDENLKVNILKWIGFVIAVLSLFLIYYIH